MIGYLRHRALNSPVSVRQARSTGAGSGLSKGLRLNKSSRRKPSNPTYRINQLAQLKRDSVRITSRILSDFVCETTGNPHPAEVHIIYTTELGVTGNSAIRRSTNSFMSLFCRYCVPMLKRFRFIPNKNALREHKPPPIRGIRISDFGLPDPKRDPDRHHNCITWSLSHALPLQKISSKSVHKFASNPTNRQTNRQTDKQTELKHNLLLRWR